MAEYIYPAMVAENPEVPGSVVANGVGQVFLPTDLTFSTPLSVRNLAGTPLAGNQIISNARGVISPFRCDYPVVVFKGSLGETAVLYSLQGTIEEMMAQAAAAVAAAEDAAAAAADAAQVTDAGMYDAANDINSQTGGLVRGLAQIPNKYVEGVPLYSLGHSYTMYPYPYGTQYTGEYYMRVARRMKMGDVFPLGRSATIAIDNWARLISPRYDSGKALWTPNSKGIAIIQNTMNELGSASAADAKFRNNWRMGILGEIAVLSSQSILGYAQKTSESAAWTSHNVTHAKKGINGEVYFNATDGAEVRWTVTGDEAFMVAPISDTYGCQPFQIKVNSTVVQSVTPQGQKFAGNDAVDGVLYDYTPGIWRVTGMNAIAGTSGNKTLTFRKNAATGNAFVTGVIQPSAKPPVIFLVKEPPRGGSGASIYNANIAWYNNEIDILAASFPNVYAVDFAPGWDNGTMIGSLDVSGGSFHPNDIGHSLMADHICKAINQYITDWRDGVVIL